MEAFTQELARICNCQSNHDSVKIIFQARMVLNIVSFLPSREREREKDLRQRRSYQSFMSGRH